MKKFIKHIIIFLLIVFITIILTITISNNLINYTSSYFKIDSRVENVILGHSHPEGTFNDSLIVNTKNFASSGELHFFTNIKAEKLLKENPKIKTVFLEFTNNQITNDMQKWTKDEEQIIYNVPKYAPHMTFSDYSYVAKHNPLGLFKSFGNVFRDNLNFFMLDKDNFVLAKGWGGYNYMTKNHVDSLIQAQKNGLVYIQDVSIFNDINLKYLDKTITYCKANKIKLFLIRSPLHKEYLGIKNETLFQDVLKKRYKDVSFIDLSFFPLKDDEYRDLDHLNYKGAKRVSLFFNELITDSVFNKKDPQIEINRRIKLLKE